MTSREEFMRQMGLSARDVEAPAEPKPSTRTNRSLEETIKPKPYASSNTAAFNSTPSKAAPQPAAQPAAVRGPAGQSREDFLRSLGIDNDQAPVASTSTPPSARNATGSQEYPRESFAPQSQRVVPPPRASASIRKPLEDDDINQHSYSPKLQPEPSDITLGRKTSSLKAPENPALDSELKQMSDAAGAEEVKNMGNKFFQAGDYRKAVRLYTRAIELDGMNAALYSNRSAAYLLGGKQMGIDTRSMALRDADKSIKLKPTWFKGFSRRGDALFKLERYEEAAAAYNTALELDPGNSSIVHSLNEIRPFVTKPKTSDKMSWSAPGSEVLHASVAAASTKSTSKSAFELLDEFHRDRERCTPQLGRGGSDYKSQEMERFRTRKTGDTNDSFYSSSQSGTYDAAPSVQTRERTSAAKEAPPPEFTSDAARDYQNALLEQYRKKKAEQQRR